MSRLVVQMLERFPLMVPNRELDQYRGFFSAGEVDLYLHVYVPHLPTVKDMVIKGMSDELAQITKDCQIEMQQWLSSNSRAFFDFLVWLQNLAMSRKVDELLAGVKPIEVPLDFWRSVVGVLSSIGDANIASVDQVDLGSFVLSVESDAGTHLLRVQAHPDGSFNCQCPNLPEKSAQLVLQSRSIGAAFKSLQQQVQDLQPFWKQLAEIDAKTWVLDPTEPNLGHTRRQISIETGFSVTVAVDPSDPLALPELSFLGPDSKVGPLESRLRNKQWRVCDESLLASLQEFLGVEFAEAAGAAASQAESQEPMCSVCFAPDALDRTCEMCQGLFHEQCLLQWLQSVPSNRTAFNRIVGQCPLCKQEISCVI
ncbi:Hypothetical predicted protein [Cloeon dipterum]|uniref:RING-type domain-containing protein n=1 Tax=Cloeon dipterum TaxID=197152 RepID=A0A8S1BV99_9INSE|nr:Hypothetical predicted protein [Cloeon dipterum]